ncbi:unnamed protein product [Adineta ricciae]|uniref:Uncharacterized protein n=1 Tax=Adineta ricciae TaxID=249248 RepID=A0A814XT02_ADIRI|nr:unnamed protein product [Adineta ricciae]CAF1489261.1 unnamed protein product [Adineta ricciae]
MSSQSVTLTNIYYDIRSRYSRIFAEHCSVFSTTTAINFLLHTHLDFLAASCPNIFSLSWGILATLYGLNHVYPGSLAATFCKPLIYLPHIGLQMTRIFLVLIVTL